MNRLSLIIICLLVVVTSGACQKKSEGALVTVGNETITEADLDLLAKVNPRLQRRLASEAGRKQVLDNYVEQELLSQEAKKRGLDSDETVKAKIDLYKKVILAQSLLEDELNQAAKEYYDSHGNEFEKIKIAHLYVPFKTDKENPALSKDAKVTRSEEQAKKRIEEAKSKLKDEPFPQVVAEYSEDTRTKEDGGDLGWVNAEDIRLKRWDWLPLVQQAMTLKEGAVSDPIKTTGGYHLVLVEEPMTKEDFEAAQSRIRFTIQQQVKNDLVSGLREDYTVEFVESQPAGKSPPDEATSPTDEAAQIE